MITRLALLLTLPLLTLLPAPALPPAPDRCASVTVARDGDVYTRGSTIGFYAVISNCGTKAVRFYTETTLETACEEEIEIGDNYWRLQPTAAFIDPQPWPIPLDACLGFYTVTTTVYVGNTWLAADSATVEVR